MSSQRAWRSPCACLSLILLSVLPACEQSSGLSEPTVTAESGGQLRARPGAIRFAVIGDSGRGSSGQHDVARQMEAQRQRFPFDFVLMLGDNVYDGAAPEDYRNKFEVPYRQLLDAGVKFYAARGNHDVGSQWLYPLFNTGGHRYF